jgi:hypothetical protein
LLPYSPSLQEISCSWILVSNKIRNCNEQLQKGLNCNHI